VIELSVRTAAREQAVDLTERIQSEIARCRAETGACLVYCPHTTAGLTINEATDPAVMSDLFTHLSRTVSDDGPWTHAEGNAPAHVKSTLVGSSVFIGIKDGRLDLGLWQGIFLCEFDGPRHRVIRLRILA